LAKDTIAAVHVIITPFLFSNASSAVSQWSQ
jgi:hypothetical protein